MILNIKNNFKIYLTIASILFFFTVVSIEVYKTINANKFVKSNQVFDEKILDALEIQISAGQKFIKIVKFEGGWKIKSPIEDFVSKSVVDNILNDIYSSSTESQGLDLAVDWNKYGLEDQALGQVSIKGADGYLLEISVSQTKSYDGSTYLKLVKTNNKKKESFLLVSQMNWLDLILKSPLDFVNKKDVFDIDLNTVKEIDLSDLGVFSKKEGLWSFRSKFEKQKIDPAKADKVLQILKNLNVFEFESKKTLNLVKSTKTITLSKTDGEIIKIQFFNHFKQCGDLENPIRCSLMSSSQAEHPFWVLETDIQPILDHKF